MKHICLYTYVYTWNADASESSAAVATAHGSSSYSAATYTSDVFSAPSASSSSAPSTAKSRYSPKTTCGWIMTHLSCAYTSDATDCHIYVYTCVDGYIYEYLCLNVHSHVCILRIRGRKEPRRKMERSEDEVAHGGCKREGEGAGEEVKERVGERLVDESWVPTRRLAGVRQEEENAVERGRSA